MQMAKESCIPETFCLDIKNKIVNLAVAPFYRWHNITVETNINISKFRVLQKHPIPDIYRQKIN
jgi:hypothetical protein